MQWVYAGIACKKRTAWDYRIALQGGFSAAAPNEKAFDEVNEKDETQGRSHPTLTTPCSMRPVTTVPRPAMLNTSSTGMENGLSRARCGTGM